MQLDLPYKLKGGICLEVSFDPGVTGARPLIDSRAIDRGRERNDVCVWRMPMPMPMPIPT